MPQGSIVLFAELTIVKRIAFVIAELLVIERDTLVHRHAANFVQFCVDVLFVYGWLDLAVFTLGYAQVLKDKDSACLDRLSNQEWTKLVRFLVFADQGLIGQLSLYLG